MDEDYRFNNESFTTVFINSVRALGEQDEVASTPRW